MQRAKVAEDTGRAATSTAALPYAPSSPTMKAQPTMSSGTRTSFMTMYSTACGEAAGQQHRQSTHSN
mgnify:CR=1 FL=1